MDGLSPAASALFRIPFPSCRSLTPRVSVVTGYAPGRRDMLTAKSLCDFDRQAV